jgi:hypothetical protein
MGLTGKQERNGIPPMVAGQDPQRGPVPDVAPLVSQAEAAAVPRIEDGRGLMGSSQGSGPAASSDVATPDRVLGDNGNIWEWDSGLAISELSGEA